MTKIKLLLLCTLLISSIVSYPTFQEYVVKFNKTYTDQERQARKVIYDTNIASFAAITDYTPGVNQLTDKTDAEINSLRTLQVLPETATSPTAKLLSAPRLGAPASLNWVEKNAVTSIKNQASCGACWAFASCAYAQSKLIIEGQYTVDNIDLSEQYMVKCTKYGTCDGGYLEYAMDAVQTVPTEQQYPYSPYTNLAGICSAKGIRTGYTTNRYYSLNDGDLINLLQAGPVAISISSSNWQSYGSGVFRCSTTASIDHAVLLVGYTDTYWIVKNQWGTNWGENGYIRITRDNNNNCKIGNSAFTLWSPHYTHLLVALVLLAVLLL